MSLSSLGLESRLLHPLGFGSQRSHSTWQTAPLGQSVRPLGSTIQPLSAPPPLSPFLQASLLNLSPDPVARLWHENLGWDVDGRDQASVDSSSDRGDELFEDYPDQTNDESQDERLPTSSAPSSIAQTSTVETSIVQASPASLLAVDDDSEAPALTDTPNAKFEVVESQLPNSPDLPTASTGDVAPEASQTVSSEISSEISSDRPAVQAREINRELTVQDIVLSPSDLPPDSQQLALPDVVPHQSEPSLQRSPSLQRDVESSLPADQQTLPPEITQPDSQPESQDESPIPAVEIPHRELQQATAPVESLQRELEYPIQTPQQPQSPDLARLDPQPEIQAKPPASPSDVPPQFSDHPLQDDQRTQSTESLQPLVQPQREERSQPTNVSDVLTPSLPNAIAPQAESSDLISPLFAATPTAASPVVDAIQTKAEPSIVTPSIAEPVALAASTEPPAPAADAIASGNTQSQAITPTDLPSSSTAQIPEPSLQPFFAPDDKQPETSNFSNHSDVSELSRQPIELETDNSSSFELPVNSTHWLHHEPRLTQPLGIHKPLVSPNLPPLQRQMERGNEEAIAQTSIADSDQRFSGFQPPAAKSPAEQPGNVPERWSSLTDLLNASTPPTPIVQPFASASSAPSELAIPIPPSHPIKHHPVEDHPEDLPQNTQSLEDGSALVSRTGNSEAKAIAPSNQPPTPIESSLTTWSTLSQLLEQSIEPQGGHEPDVQKQELAVSPTESLADTEFITLAPESPVAIATPTQATATGTSTTASNTINPQDLDHLAKQMYSAIRQQLELDRERQSGQFIGCPSWYSPVVPQPQQGDRSSPAGSARASPDPALETHFQNLMREVYNQLRQRLELERERHGSGFTHY